MADLDKVKRNIKRMIDADAPDADIDAYLADEGVSQNELQAPAKAVEPDVMTKLHDPNTLLGKPLQFMDDLTNVSGDAVTRGFGENDTTDAAVQASRERLGWGAVPVDVISSVVSSPYKIGSMGVGALAGAAEGAASAYGHQEGWVPGWDVLKGAGEGAAFGAGGAKLGEWLGGGKATREAEAARPYKTQADIDVAAAQGGAEAVDRAAVSRAAEAAQGAPRDELARMLSGMNLTPDVEAKVADIAGARGKTIAAGKIADATGKQMPPIPLLVLESVLSGGIPWKTLAGMGVKHAISKTGQSASKVSGKEATALADLARNDALQIDPATIDRLRDTFAKAGIGYGREP